LVKDPSKAIEGLKGAVPGTGDSGGSSSPLDDPVKSLKKLFGR
jgi:hypothetical protein